MVSTQNPLGLAELPSSVCQSHSTEVSDSDIHSFIHSLTRYLLKRKLYSRFPEKTSNKQEQMRESKLWELWSHS